MMLIATPGCILAPLIAANERKGSHMVAPKYTGLTGKSFAVVVAADRSIQASYPVLVGQVTKTVSEHLTAQQDLIGASGLVPPETVLGFQYQHPQWNTWTLQKLAQELGVERLIFIDIQEFRLNEPGNQYLWKGAAGALVGVVEADSDTSESFAFSEPISVQYPTKETALSPAQASGDQIEVMLAKRLVDRTAWLFFEHEEANIIDY
jgi:hypothetical protein